MESEVLKPILAGVVRHGLTALGGMLVTDGVMQSSEMNGFIGAGMVIAGIAWSWYQKVGQAKLVALMAKMNPVASKSATTGEAVKAAQAAAKAEVAK
jgi:hypothetical protein